MAFEIVGVLGIIYYRSSNNQEFKKLEKDGEFK